jgi:hypothetical protein
MSIEEKSEHWTKVLRDGAGSNFLIGILTNFWTRRGQKIHDFAGLER